MFRKKSKLLHIATLLRCASFTSHAISDFEFLSFFGHIVVFCQCGFKSLEMLKSWGHARKLVYFTREIAPNDEYLIQFFPNHKVLWMN